MPVSSSAQTTPVSLDPIRSSCCSSCCRSFLLPRTSPDGARHRSKQSGTAVSSDTSSSSALVQRGLGSSKPQTSGPASRL